MSDHYSISNVVITTDAVPTFSTQSPLYIPLPHENELLPPTPTIEKVENEPLSQRLHLL